jgi:mersacidin/lichenicidin family type 2 lantibiotic
MSKIDVIRAWKDELYRNSLSEEERALLPENPAGLIELTDEDLGLAAGGVTLNGPNCSVVMCGPPAQTINIHCGDSNYPSCPIGGTNDWNCVPNQTFAWQCLTLDYTQLCTMAIPQCN